ncbi:MULTISPECIES: hypothetical protein [unclassified Pseudomonas]|jgi:3-oxoacyl-[acyl-carrier-protein] synthase III|uniref:hypothetical protein n=1 Tax=unclassified Pseudomonas TaxID=196821 RepID=UPI0018CAAA74|nr:MULTISPECIES: hypothetical protein [unclassified Pseudomonas]MBM7395394.1 3-oxoacyl-[acyl-carrier-protein] synthase III [Pseudomonas sp. M5]QPN47221.1 hypothetical protein I5S86_10180 [Priestia aryabhattai]GLH31593.1 hypothetical protein BR1R5_09790 [Pseudomonas sp. BR1R-5]HDS1755487.1 hypothetical protein [Pseudomonas putida]
MSEVALIDGALSCVVEWLERDGRVLFGAVLGALLVSAARDRLVIVSRKRLTLGKQALLALLTVGVGYLFEPLLQALAPMLSRGMAAFVAAVVVVPISLKVMVWLDSVDLREIVQRWRRRS